MLLTEQGGKKVEWKFTRHIFHIGLQTTRKEIKYEKRDFCMKLRYLKMFLKFKVQTLIKITYLYFSSYSEDLD